MVGVVWGGVMIEPNLEGFLGTAEAMEGMRVIHKTANIGWSETSPLQGYWESLQKEAGAETLKNVSAPEDKTT